MERHYSESLRKFKEAILDTNCHHDSIQRHCGFIKQKLLT